MNKETILTTLHEALETGFYILEGEEVIETTTFDDLKLDSLDKVEIAMVVEDTFEITLPNDSFSELETIKEAVDLISNHL
jgi:acyl carrier protein|tara:strand:+ start:465 stop:704 length:240 start_codon:yes stop_codon:yes gene_type:complete